MGHKEGDAGSPTGAAIEGEGSGAIFHVLIDDSLSFPSACDHFEMWSEAFRTAIHEIVPVALMNRSGDVTFF